MALKSFSMNKKHTTKGRKKPHSFFWVNSFMALASILIWVFLMTIGIYMSMDEPEIMGLAYIFHDFSHYIKASQPLTNDHYNTGHSIRSFAPFFCTTLFWYTSRVCVCHFSYFDIESEKLFIYKSVEWIWMDVNLVAWLIEQLKYVFVCCLSFDKYSHLMELLILTFFFNWKKLLRYWICSFPIFPVIKC